MYNKWEYFLFVINSIQFKKKKIKVIIPQGNT